MDFYIFRHGETFFSKNETSYGDAVESAEILPESIPTIKRLAKYLKNIKTDANFSSTYLRCRQTSEIVSQITNKEFIFDDRLRDYYDGREPVENVIKRIKDFLNSISTKKYKAVIVCTHGYPIAILKGLITKGNFEMKDLSTYPRSGILVEIKKGKVQLYDFN